MEQELTIEYLWNLKGFKPNDNQKNAILETEGPLFLTAGPGSGKTRVLLWRTLNLIVFHNIEPKDIFLATFTEKAAHQLKEGLRGLLGIVTNETGQPYDISGKIAGNGELFPIRRDSDSARPLRRQIHPADQAVAMEGGEVV